MYKCKIFNALYISTVTFMIFIRINIGMVIKHENRNR